MKSYTKDIIANALKELAERKSLQKITVNDIVSKCEVSKQTFYNHFKDKYDLFEYAFVSDLRNNLEEAMKAGLDYQSTVLCYYKKTQIQKDFYQLFIRDEYLRMFFMKCVSDSSNKYVRRQLKYNHGQEVLTSEIELSIEFNGIGSAKLLAEWIAGNIKETPEVMANVVCNCIPAPLRKYFNDEKILNSI